MPKSLSEPRRCSRGGLSRSAWPNVAACPANLQLKSLSLLSISLSFSVFPCNTGIPHWESTTAGPGNTGLDTQANPSHAEQFKKAPGCFNSAEREELRAYYTVRVLALAVLVPFTHHISAFRRLPCYWQFKVTLEYHHHDVKYNAITLADASFVLDPATRAGVTDTTKLALRDDRTQLKVQCHSLARCMMHSMWL